jgi:hypothetical protein
MLSAGGISTCRPLSTNGSSRSCVSVIGKTAFVAYLGAF